ncbi:MAG TPA: Flp pilus assembly protein CpaB [Candidatus Limnocylindria bacterium]|nr:Flp pilus assembly protein CpaB [Candidatus Limnocylindria bacterium]
MKRANRLMLIAGVMLAGVAFVAVLAFGGMGTPTVVTPPADVNVVVAAVDLALGTELTPDKLTTQARAQADASGTYQRPEELVGKIVRRTVAAGQALTAADFDTNSQAEIAQSLQTGQVAIAVPLSKVDAVGMLLQPGDRVDVLISMKDLDGLNPIVQPNPNGGQTTVDGSAPDPYIILDSYLNNTTVKVVVQNVQVLAVQPKSGDGANLVANTAPEPDVIVVMAVSAQQSEIVRYGQLDGNISLVLRAPTDAGAADAVTTGITLRWLVDHYGVLPPQAVTP